VCTPTYPVILENSDDRRNLFRISRNPFPPYRNYKTYRTGIIQHTISKQVELIQFLREGFGGNNHFVSEEELAPIGAKENRINTLLKCFDFGEIVFAQWVPLV